MASRAIAVGAPAQPVAWVLDSPRDLLLLIATPLLIVPAAAVAQLQLSVEDIGMYVAAFGALGHHLPGMMRAYGDRELFERFRARFIAAPIFLVAVCIGFSLAHLQALAVITLLWGLWHGLAQVYGFARIYDAKAGMNSRFTAELDKGLCIAWFGAGVLFSQGRLGNLLEVFYQSGGPIVAAGSLRAFQAAWAAGTGVVTAAFAANFAWRRLRGQPQSSIKLLLLGSSIAFWWYAMIGISNVILGIALFEIFHDVQYLAITWAYNRRLVGKRHGMGPFARFLFRPRAWLLALYVGLVLCYGGIALVEKSLGESLLQRALLGAIVASGFLHFYYDGFIWKVRERAIRDGLDLEGGVRALRPDSRLPAWLVHGLRWLPFAVPLLWLGMAEANGLAASKVARYAALVETLPGDAGTRVKLGIALSGAGRADEAMQQYREALALDPSRADAHARLGDLYRDAQDWPRAIEAFQTAIALGADANAHNNLGLVYQAQGRLDLAARAFESAAARGLDAGHWVNLGSVRLAQGRIDEARRLYDQALGLDPASGEAHYNLGVLLQQQGRLEDAVEHLARAAQLKPRHPAVRRLLGDLEAELAGRERRRQEIESTIRGASPL